MTIEEFERDCATLQGLLDGKTSHREARAILSKLSFTLIGVSEKIGPIQRYLNKKHHDDRDEYYLRVDIQGLTQIGRRSLSNI